MNKGIGVICLAVVGLLVGRGYYRSQSINGEFTRIFIGSPGDKTMWRNIGGGVLCAFGAFQCFASKQ